MPTQQPPQPTSRGLRSHHRSRPWGHDRPNQLTGPWPGKSWLVLISPALALGALPGPPMLADSTSAQIRLPYALPHRTHQKRQDRSKALGELAKHRRPRPVTPHPQASHHQPRLPRKPTGNALTWEWTQQVSNLRPIACKVRPDCRGQSLTWDSATGASARIGPRRVPLWSVMVVSAQLPPQQG